MRITNAIMKKLILKLYTIESPSNFISIRMCFLKKESLFLRRYFLHFQIQFPDTTHAVL